jgi:hypothetical protein
LRNRTVSKAVFIVVLLILLINAVVSAASVIEDGVLLRRAVPAACWTIATIAWVAAGGRRASRGD